MWGQSLVTGLDTHYFQSLMGAGSGWVCGGHHCLDVWQNRNRKKHQHNRNAATCTFSVKQALGATVQLAPFSVIHARYTSAQLGLSANLWDSRAELRTRWLSRSFPALRFLLWFFCQGKPNHSLSAQIIVWILAYAYLAANVEICTIWQNGIWGMCQTHTRN